jgi:hypothetical protein
MTQQVGHYANSDLVWYLEHDNTILLEVDSVNYGFDPVMEPGGSGLGYLKNTYYKTTGPTKGTWQIDRKLLTRSDKGMLFLDLLAGTRYMIQEAIASSAVSYTVALNTSFTSILEIRLNTSNLVLAEGIDYTVSWITGTVTFTVALPEAATIKYYSFSRKNKNYLLNGSFEDALGSTWVATGTSVITRNTTNAYVDSNALQVVPSTTSDGFKYNVPLTLQPGRQYRLRFRAKAASNETLVPTWNDGTTDQSMTAVTGATLSTSYSIAEYVFTATKAAVPNITIKDTKATPATFYVDEFALLDDTTGNFPTLGNNPMDSGLAQPFTFNIVARRVGDGVIVHHFKHCALDSDSVKSGTAYTESVKGLFLDYDSE